MLLSAVTEPVANISIASILLNSFETAIQKCTQFLTPAINPMAVGCYESESNTLWKAGPLTGSSADEIYFEKHQKVQLHLWIEMLNSCVIIFCLAEQRTWFVQVDVRVTAMNLHIIKGIHFTKDMSEASGLDHLECGVVNLPAVLCLYIV